MADIIFYLILFYTTFCWKACLGADVAELFSKHHIVPDVIPTQPDEICEVRFKPLTLVETGYTYNEYQIPGIPEVNWHSRDGKLYSLIVLGAKYHDPTNLVSNIWYDTPTPEWVHWVVFDIIDSNVTTGQEIRACRNFTIEKESKAGMVYIFVIVEHDMFLTPRPYYYTPALDKHIINCIFPIPRILKNYKKLRIHAGNFFFLNPELKESEMSYTTHDYPKFK